MIKEMLANCRKLTEAKAEHKNAVSLLVPRIIEVDVQYPTRDISEQIAIHACYQQQLLFVELLCIFEKVGGELFFTLG